MAEESKFHGWSNRGIEGGGRGGMWVYSIYHWNLVSCTSSVKRTKCISSTLLNVFLLIKIKCSYKTDFRFHPSSSDIKTTHHIKARYPHQNSFFSSQCKTTFHPLPPPLTPHIHANTHKSKLAIKLLHMGLTPHPPHNKTSVFGNGMASLR